MTEMLRTTAAIPQRHVFDGGRSLAIHHAAEPILDELRALLHADVGLLLFESRAGLCALACACDAGVAPPLRNEPMRTLTVGSSLRPHTAQDMLLLSTVREYRLRLGSALIVPWREATGRGWLILGALASSWRGGPGDRVLAARYATLLRDLHDHAADRGTAQLTQDLAHAVHAVTCAEREATSVGDLLATITFAARELLGTNVAYVSLPEQDGDAFAFTSLLGIHTSAFRRLRVRHGHGLGGLAREARRTVRSIDYASDSRLQAAPVKETVDEGIVSAMCSPLVVDGSIAACLYVGNREMTAFSDTDAALFEEFAGHAAASLRHSQLEAHRLEVMRQREQERLAHSIHDSVVRSLMQIGFEAEEGLLSADDTALKQRLSSIGQTAEYCLETLREQLAVMAGDRVQNQDVSIGELTERLRTVHRRADVERTFELRGAQPWDQLPEAVAKALTRIGQEALVNAELHSHCTREHIVVALAEGLVELAIIDNGVGMSESAGDGTTAHFGLRAMRAAALELGGQLTVVPEPNGGLAVRARIPLATGVEAPDAS